MGRKNINEAITEYAAHVKLEIVCHDELVDRITAVIVKAASTGLRGDGLLYVTPVENVVRISEGECALRPRRT